MVSQSYKHTKTFLKHSYIPAFLNYTHISCQPCIMDAWIYLCRPHVLNYSAHQTSQQARTSVCHSCTKAQCSIHSPRVPCTTHPPLCKTASRTRTGSLPKKWLHMDSASVHSFAQHARSRYKCHPHETAASSQLWKSRHQTDKRVEKQKRLAPLTSVEQRFREASNQRHWRKVTFLPCICDKLYRLWAQKEKKKCGRIICYWLIVYWESLLAATTVVFLVPTNDRVAVKTTDKL